MFFKSIFSQGDESSNLFIGWERLPCKGNSHQAEKRQVLHRHQVRVSQWRSQHWGHPFWRWISWILGRNYTYEPGIYGGKKIEWCEVLTITMVNLFLKIRFQLMVQFGSRTHPIKSGLSVLKMTGSPGQTRPLMWINKTLSWEKICKLIFFQIPVGIWWHWVRRGHYLLVLGGAGSVLGGTDWYLIVLGR